MKASNYFKSKPDKSIDLIISRFSNKIFINASEDKCIPVKIDREKILKKIIDEKEKK